MAAAAWPVPVMLPIHRGIVSETVKVLAHDLHRLLLEFRAQVERGDRPPGGRRGGWHHAVDYDKSFERLADTIDVHLKAAGCPPDPRTRCQHDNPVYSWPESPRSVAWINVSAGPVSGDTGPRLRHLAASDTFTRFKALCGFTFVNEDIAGPDAGYRRCGVCVREQQLLRDGIIVRSEDE